LGTTKCSKKSGEEEESFDLVKRTYLDANVLLAAFRGSESSEALKVPDDPERLLLVSDFVRLEVLPKPRFLKQEKEVEFMEAIFEVAESIPISPELTEKAIEFASLYDISGLDALHVGAAVSGKADELITLEKATKPMFRSREVRVVSLHPDQGDAIDG
jgi:predicted nucleic acid-binding protein